MIPGRTSFRKALGLVFGNTWLVVAVAIVGVLVMGYLANQWVLRFGPVRPALAFLCLGVALAAGLGADHLPMGKLLMPIVLTLPLFFAGLIFSTLLAGGKDIGSALSANLFGAMLGGFLEYNSMYFGLRSLYPLGIAIYVLAFVCILKLGKGKGEGEGEWTGEGDRDYEAAALVE